MSEEGIHSSEGQRSPKACRTKKTTPKLFTPSKPSYQNSRYFGGSSMSSSVADLPTFSPSLFAPSAFNYARPRQFIQSQPAFQAPSYNVAQALPQPNGNSSKASPSSPNLSFPISTPASSQLTVFPRDPPPPSSTAQSMSHSCAPMRSTITLTPRAYAGVPAPPEPKPQSSPAAFLCSVLPSQSTPQYKPAPMSIPQPPSPAHSSHSPNPPSPLPKPRFDAPLHMALPTHSLPMSRSPHSQTPTTVSMPQPSFPPPSCVSLPPSYRGTPNM